MDKISDSIWEPHETFDHFFPPFPHPIADKETHDKRPGAPKEWFQPTIPARQPDFGYLPPPCVAQEPPEGWDAKIREFGNGKGAALIGFTVDVKKPPSSAYVPYDEVVNLNGKINFHHVALSPENPVNTPKFSLTGADENLVASIHRTLCWMSPAKDLSAYSAVLASLSPADVALIEPVMSNIATQASDLPGIMAMRAPLPAPETPVPAVKPTPEGLSTITGMDHRLGAWK